MALFPRSFVYEDRASDAIAAASENWNAEHAIAAIEWAIAHDPQIGRLIGNTGLRGFVYPGARSINEPDIDVIYRDNNPVIVIEDLVFREAKAHHVGSA